MKLIFLKNHYQGTYHILKNNLISLFLFREDRCRLIAYYDELYMNFQLFFIFFDYLIFLYVLSLYKKFKIKVSEFNVKYLFIFIISF